MSHITVIFNLRVYDIFYIGNQSFWQKPRYFLSNIGSCHRNGFQNSFSGIKFDFEADYKQDRSFIITLPTIDIEGLDEGIDIAGSDEDFKKDQKSEFQLELNLDRSSYVGINIDCAVIEKVKEGINELFYLFIPNCCKLISS
jgi:hypothetical protein